MRQCVNNTFDATYLYEPFSGIQLGLGLHMFTNLVSDLGLIIFTTSIKISFVRVTDRKYIGMSPSYIIFFVS